VPVMATMSALSYLHLAPPLLEIAVAATAPVAGVGVTILFLREWRAAILQGRPEALSDAG
jgi:hypothetical protein